MLLLLLPGARLSEVKQMEQKKLSHRQSESCNPFAVCCAEITRMTNETKTLTWGDLPKSKDKISCNVNQSHPTNDK